MWVYRISGFYHNVEATRPLSQISGIMRGRPAMHPNLPLDNYHTLSMAWAKAQELWRQIDWDGTVSDEPRVFMVPGPVGFAYGFSVLTTDRRTFIASPCPLPHVQETLDWNAYTDIDETKRARQMIIEGEPDKPVMNTILKWTRSRRGNLVTFHENSVMTVFPDNKSGGYKGVVSFGDSLKTFTPTMRTEADVCAHIITNYEKLKRELTSTAEPLDPDDPWHDGD